MLSACDRPYPGNPDPKPEHKNLTLGGDQRFARYHHAEVVVASLDLVELGLGGALGLFLGGVGMAQFLDRRALALGHLLFLPRLIVVPVGLDRFEIAARGQRH